MKKFLLGVAIAATALSVNAAKWAVVGGYSNWDFAQSVVMEQDGDVFKATIPTLTTEWKVVDIENNTWDIAYGTNGEAIVLGETYYPETGDGLGNIAFEQGINAVKNAVVVWDPANVTILVTGDVDTSNPALWITGSFCDWSNPGEGASVAMDLDGDIYTATVDFGAPESPVEFKIAGSGWSPQYCFTQEDADAGTEWNGAAYVLVQNGQNIKTSLTGVQNITFNIATMTISAGEGSGVEGVEVEENVAPVYYNLQGVKVANPENGVYVVVRGAKVSKEVVK